MTTPDWDQLQHDVSTAFTPASPVSEDALFAGRIEQLRRVIDAINEKGQHVIVYGERGVGKTSLANILSSRLVSTEGARAVAPRVNCDTTDSFATIWRKALAHIETTQTATRPGFRETATESVGTVADGLDPEEPVTPDTVRRMLARLGGQHLLVIILDEFDRVSNAAVRRAFADTIKSLSDHAVPATLVLVGVADTVGELIAEHHSVGRALTQVPMPRMNVTELHEILDRGTARLGLEIENGAKVVIAGLSHGLPNYAHRLGLDAARSAIGDRRRVIRREDVSPAVEKAVANAEQSLQDDYRQAISSPQKGNLYGRVLLACALAKADEFGYFAAADVREPLSQLMGKRCEIPTFAKHLNDFSRATRSSILRKSGEKHRYRYRFTSPLMQPFVVMKGMVDGLVKP